MAVKTLLKVVQETCYRINEPAPSSLFGSTDPNNLQWLHLLYEAGEWVRNNFDYPPLKRKYSFATVSGIQDYALPGDFWRLLFNTQWDDTNQWALFGPASDGEMAARNKGTTLSDTQFSYKITGAPFQAVSGLSFDNAGGYLEISPTVSDVRTLSIEYIGANWFYPAQWVTATGYSLDDLVSANGNIYKCTDAITSSDVRPTGTTTANDDDGEWTMWRERYNETGADTDYPIIDPELLYLSLRAAWLRSKGLDDSQFAELARQAATSIQGRFQGIQGTKADGDDLYEFPWLSEDYVSTGW